METPILKLINVDRMVDFFVRIAKVDTGSKESLAEKGVIPSSENQKILANVLVGKLEALGLTDVYLDEHFVVTATLASNIGNDAPVIGLLAHMDTSFDVPTGPVKPLIHDYNGGDLKLTPKVVIQADDLKKYKGQKIITTNGKTLLGADDKAGIAEIIEAISVFKENPQLRHPNIRIAFTPDEETGMGATKFDIKRFGADVAYTIDGDLPSVIENESFNAFNPEIVINGKNVHTGYAKGKMINSVKVANWIIGKLPKNETPEMTSGRQGFFHVNEIKGNTTKTTMKMLVRDHDFDIANQRIDLLKKLIEQAQEKFGCIISFNPKEKYRNMKSEIDKLPEVVDYAKEGIKKSGLIPETVAIRGGTDGSHLSLHGLLTPNLGAGGHNFHSKSEFLPVEEMKKCAENIVNIMIVWAEKSKEVMPKLLLRR